jgi:hypothetical protein
VSPSIRPVLARGLSVIALIAFLVAGCGTISRTPPAPTPADFPGMAAILTNHGITVTNIVSGDAGCSDPVIAKTAIGFDAVGADQATPVRIHVFIFRNRQTYEAKRSTVDTCAAEFVTDPATFESVESSPYVAAGQGPWAAAFKERFRSALVEAAGTGG